MIFQDRWIRISLQDSVLFPFFCVLFAATAGVAEVEVQSRYDVKEKKTYFDQGDVPLAVYNHSGNTFIEFWHEGVNLIGGFSSGPNGTNHGGALKGHSADYPFGWVAPDGKKPQWEGFWAGFAYLDQRWKFWEGVAGNPFAQQSFTVDPLRKDLQKLHVSLKVGPLKDPLFQCEVDYFISPRGIGVRNHVTVLRDLEPIGFDDTGGQFMMTQVDCDLDPSQSYDEAHQPDLYYKLALNQAVFPIHPFPPEGGYNSITPSNIYADQNVLSSPKDRVHPLPNTALVPSTAPLAILAPLGRPSRNVNLALRVDLKHSYLPPLEYYCEYNGERDYLNFLFSAAQGLNRSSQKISKGTKWLLYGDLIPWKGEDVRALEKIPLLSPTTRDPEK